MRLERPEPHVRGGCQGQSPPTFPRDVWGKTPRGMPKPKGFRSPGRRKRQADRQGGKIEARSGRDSRARLDAKHESPVDAQQRAARISLRPNWTTLASHTGTGRKQLDGLHEVDTQQVHHEVDAATSTLPCAHVKPLEARHKHFPSEARGRRQKQPHRPLVLLRHEVRIATPEQLTIVAQLVEHLRQRHFPHPCESFIVKGVSSFSVQ